jgi:comEA protein
MRAYKTGIWLAISFFTGIIVGVGGLALMNRVQPAPLIIQPAAPTHPPEPTVTPGPMRVFVNGQVTVPDVYELPTDSIVKTLINLNTASLEELDALPGIGPSTAQKIIEHRDENGPFTSIEGVMDVSGIGEAKFDQMKDLITIEGD